MKRDKKTLFYTLLKVIVAVSLIVYFYRKNDWNTVIESVRDVSVYIWCILLFCLFIETVFKTIRWRMLLPEAGFLELFIVSVKAGFFFLVLPGQLIAEGVKPFLLKNSNISKGRIAMSVLVDKILGVVAVFLSGFLGLALTSVDLGKGVKEVLLLAIISIIAGLFLIRVEGIYGVIRHLLEPGNISIINKLKKAILKIVDTWNEYVKNPGTIIWCIILGVVPQLSTVLSGYIVSCDIGAGIGFVDWLWIDAYSTLALLLPVTIGGIGVRDGSLVSAMSILGVSAYIALTVSMVLFIMQVVRAVIGLVVYLADREH